MKSADMKAALGATKGRKARKVEDSTTLLEGTAHIIGAVPSVGLKFWDDIKTSYQYNEAKRKGEL